VCASVLAIPLAGLALKSIPVELRRLLPSSEDLLARQARLMVATTVFVGRFAAAMENGAGPPMACLALATGEAARRMPIARQAMLVPHVHAQAVDAAAEG
jgi:hypothetical protein